MLPVNNVPGYNLHMYQPASVQGKATILGQSIPPTQIPLHIKNQQFLSSNLQPLIDNPIHHQVTTTNKQKKKNQTPWPLVRERTIPTDRPPLVDEI
jgi:hypothetical protein